MNRVFYIFRHGETDWNKAYRFQGHTDIHLNETGLGQARALAEKLESLELDVIYSSDLMRAFKTGETVALKKNIPINIDSRLRETYCGKAEGMHFDEILAVFGQELWDKMKIYSTEYEDLCFPEGESRKAARARFLAVIHELIAHPTYKRIGISTHGGILRNALHSFLPDGHPLIEIPNCVVYKLTYNTLTKEFTFDLKPL
jgi:broad specificity phosphatase PhoE